MIIGIEGPAGSGKSTMARTVAAQIDAVVMESGAWFRALTYAALQAGIDLADTTKLVQLADELNIRVEPADDGGERIFIDEADVTRAIYEGVVSASVPEVSKQIAVRDAIGQRFADQVRGQGVVFVVGRHLKRAFPEAAVLRLTIDAAEAERRHALRAKVVTHQVAERNAADRAIAEMLGTAGDDTPELDVTNLTPEEQAEALRRFVDQARS